jgi:uncharacterized membrane protein
LTVRVLDALALGLAAALAGCLAFGWWRPEDVFLAGLAVVGLRLWRRPLPLPRGRPRRVVALGVAAYAALFSFVTLSRHWTFLTHALDLGYYVQLTWNLARGAGPRVSLPEMHAWGDHLSPILYLLVPLVWLWPGPGALLVAQSAVLGAGAVAVFAVARRRLGDERVAAGFALLYLLNPSLHGMNVRDFHAAVLAVPLLLAAAAFAEAGRALPCAAALALTLACREDAAIAVAGFGLWLALGRGRRLLGAGIAAGALALLWIELRWLIPFFRGAPYVHLGRYAALGGSLGELLLAPLRQPLRTARLLLDGRRAVYLLAMLAPLGFLPLAAPAELLGALPALAQNLLSSDPVLFHHRTQYQAFVLPFLVLAAVAGHARLAGRGPWSRRALAVAALASLALSARTVNQLAVDRWWPSPAHRAAHQVLAAVAPEEAVSAQDPYVPHLSLRPLVFVFPMGIERADAVLVNLASYPWRALPGVRLARAGPRVTITVDGVTYRYTVAAEAGSHLLLRRAPSPG